jgi:hypothetical protein
MADEEYLPAITAVTVEGPYRLRLVFDDGLTKSVDLEHELWGPAFNSLRDPDIFSQVSVDEELGTIVWPNGADFSPEFLYDYPESTARDPETTVTEPGVGYRFSTS